MLMNQDLFIMTSAICFKQFWHISFLLDFDVVQDFIIFAQCPFFLVSNISLRVASVSCPEGSNNKLTVSIIGTFKIKLERLELF